MAPVPASSSRAGSVEELHSSTGRAAASTCVWGRVSSFGVEGLGLRVWGLRFRIWGSGCGVYSGGRGRVGSQAAVQGSHRSIHLCKRCVVSSRSLFKRQHDPCVVRY